MTLKKSDSEGPAEPAKQRRRLQMSDIARLAGVSTATVSRALNGSPLVTKETRERIAALAQAQNYTINAGAKNLRLGQNHTIAVVVPYESETRQRLSDPFFLSLLGSIADALTERGYDMLLSRVDARELDSVAKLYNAGRAAGIVLIGQWRHHDQLNEMARRGLPIVVWGAQLPDQHYCTVGCDNIAGGRLATDHLIANGRRKIAFMGDTGLPEVAHRLEGYRRSLLAHGLPFDDQLCIPASFLAEGARRAVQELLARKVPFDAVFACSDVLAMTAISSLQERGISVPAQVSVVGYDDIEMATNFHPPLTTVRQPIEAGGRELVSALLELVDDGEHTPRLLPTQLVVRETTAPAA